MGVDALASIKFSALIALLLLVIGVFAWARVLAGSRAGVLASVIVAFAPVFLSMLFRDGDWSLIWTMAGLAWAAFGLLSLPWWGLALATVGAFAATAVHPGLGVWAVAGLILLTIGNKRWLGIVAVVVHVIPS